MHSTQISKSGSRQNGVGLLQQDAPHGVSSGWHCGCVVVVVAGAAVVVVVVQEACARQRPPQQVPADWSSRTQSVSSSAGTQLPPSQAAHPVSNPWFVQKKVSVPQHCWHMLLPQHVVAGAGQIDAS
jgi:hypothetical protein